MSRICQRPFTPCGSYENKAAAKNAILDFTDNDQEWEVNPHTHSFVDRDGDTQVRYSILRLK